ncbi:uncharacterized protein LOC108604397 [Drosophila busckii]|uniref:uncharacterized protein LOC108604397 n=1 Tax=Drosophila busckii TaxID=30019 RepID=UPI00083EE6FF|nr:uncharacterized protein LOC108604397 [Drosophila busckii]
MPPFCCGGRTCAEDLKRGQTRKSDASKAESILNITDAERPLTLKFYARHDWPYFNCSPEELARWRGRTEADDRQDLLNVSTAPNVEKQIKKYDPKHVTATPLTENQIYGWYQDRAYRYTPKDRGVFVFPREADPLIKIILASNMAAKISK